MFPNSPDHRWWTLAGDEAAAAITRTINLLQQHQVVRQNQYVTSARLYGNMAIGGYAGVSYNRFAAAQNSMRERISYNAVQSAIDAITSKIGKNKPEPFFLTSGGDYETQRKAKKLNWFVRGVFAENKAYDLGISAFRDGCIWGDGITKVVIKDGRIRFERVLAHELLVDEIEGQYGEPRQLHQVRQADRAVLMDSFPSKRKVIEEATEKDTNTPFPNVADMVTVRESWHLPSGPGAKDGRHCISLDGHLLTWERWDHDWFPFARFRWSPRPIGYWSQGLAEQIQNIQLEINKLLWTIQRSFHMAGTFKIFIENGSKIVKEHLTNEVGAIINYTGNPPQYVTPPSVQPEIFAHFDRLRAAAYEQAGISMLSAASQKPAGLNSGRALREYNDIESDRFQTIGKAYEDYFLQLAKIAIHTVKDLAEDEPSYKVKVPARSFLKEVDWSEVEVPEDGFQMQCFSVSSLPNEPAGRLQTVTEMMSAGMLDMKQGRRLMNFPDLEQVDSLYTASEDYLESILDDIVDGKAYTPPEPFDDLGLARTLALEYYQRGKLLKLAPESLEDLRTFISQIDILQQAAQAASVAASAGPTQAQPATPAQPDLAPTVQ